jgi:hypothetical protein
MKSIITFILVAAIVISCSKEESQAPANFGMDGYWNVLRDTTFTSNAANSGSDLYHLFRSPNAYYRFSFLKTHDFSVLTSQPRSDSMISFFQIIGDQLMIPNPAPSTTNIVPGNDLLSRSDNEMLFTRTVITKRNATTGKIEGTRIDTIRYLRVTDPTKVKYFDNYLKKWHP